MHVLIVDDDADVRRSLAKALEQHGISVTLAENGQQGLRAVRRRLFDAVVSDIVMPVMDGAAMYEALRADHPDRLSHLCFMTAYEDEDTVAGFLRSTARPVLAKPFELSKFMHLVESVVAPTEAPAVEAVEVAPFTPGEVARIRRQLVTPGRGLECPRCGGELTTDLPLAGGASMALVWEVKCEQCRHSVVVRDLPEPA